jgi:hypothetical protein
MTGAYSTSHDLATSLVFVRLLVFRSERNISEIGCTSVVRWEVGELHNV